MTQGKLFPDLGEALTPPAQRHSATSRAAAEAVEPRAATLRRAALEAIRAAADGLTDEEGVDATGMGGSTWRPRRVELVGLGLVRDSGRVRKVRSGKRATVWVAV